MSAMVEKKKLQRRNWDEEDEEYEVRKLDCLYFCNTLIACWLTCFC